MYEQVQWSLYASPGPIMLNGKLRYLHQRECRKDTVIVSLGAFRYRIQPIASVPFKSRCIQYHFYKKRKLNNCYSLSNSANLQAISSISYVVEMMQNVDVMNRRQFPQYWSFIWGIHLWPVNPPVTVELHRRMVNNANINTLSLAWKICLTNSRYVSVSKRHGFSSIHSLIHWGLVTLYGVPWFGHY